MFHRLSHKFRWNVKTDSPIIICVVRCRSVNFIFIHCWRRCHVQFRLHDKLLHFNSKCDAAYVCCDAFLIISTNECNFSLHLGSWYLLNVGSFICQFWIEQLLENSILLIHKCLKNQKRNTFDIIITYHGCVVVWERQALLHTFGIKQSKSVQLQF